MPSVISFGAGGGAGSDTTAVHTDTGGELNALSVPAGGLSAADIMLIEDASASNAKKKVLLGSLGGIYIPAEQMVPRVTNGPSAGSFESSSNKRGFNYWAFDDATDEAVTVNFDLSGCPVFRGATAVYLRVGFFIDTAGASGGSAVGFNVDYAYFYYDGTTDPDVAWTTVGSPVASGITHTDNDFFTAIDATSSFSGATAAYPLHSIRLTRDTSVANNIDADLWVTGLTLLPA